MDASEGASGQVVAAKQGGVGPEKTGARPDVPRRATVPAAA